MTTRLHRYYEAPKAELRVGRDRMTRSLRKTVRVRRADSSKTATSGAASRDQILPRRKKKPSR
jgi:hypothetical protein